MDIKYIHPFDMFLTGGSIYSAISLGGALTHTLGSSSIKSDVVGGSACIFSHFNCILYG